MAIVTKPFTFSAGATIIASEHNSVADILYNDYNGNITSANISASAAIPYSKLSLTSGVVNADVSASAAIVGSKLDLTSPGAIGSTSAGTGAFSTLKVGTTHQGDILYDNGTSIIRLTPGTSGQVLQTQGAAANPQWSAGPGLTFVSNTAISAATNTGDIAITNTNFYYFNAHCTGFSAGGDTLNIRMNNDNTATKYKYVYSGRTSGGALTGGSESADLFLLGTAINNIDAEIEGRIFPQVGGTGKIYISGKITYVDNAGGLMTFVDFSGYWDNSAAATSFRLFTSGVITFSGNLYLYKHTLS